MHHVCSLARPGRDSKTLGRLLMLSPRLELHSSSGEGHKRHDHERLLGQMQELRGRVYLRDQAIQDCQLRNGRHHLPSDHESWHILIEGAQGEIQGCVFARLHHPSAPLSSLAVSRSAIAADPRWRNTLTGALEREMELARRLQIPVLEVGGLALDEALRGSSAVLQMVFAIYGLARTLGGAIGISTVTTRHQASCLLRKLGGTSLSHESSEIPPYFDHQYGCEMEILKFYSWTHSLRHESRFASIQEQVSEEIPSRFLNHWKAKDLHHPLPKNPSPAAQQIQ